ncbi:MAG: cysteine--tRNA ligase [Anaerolineales bacterium]
MKLYNNLDREIQTFKPEGDAITVYACGITPYDTTHLGHAFTYLTVDVLIRYLEFCGHTVRYVQNVTDIDDDVLKRAKEVGQDWLSLVNQWTHHFIQDMQSLNVRPPDVFPKATEGMPEIQEMVSRLLEVGVAYQADGNVYFDLNAWPRYGELSRLSRQEMLPIANQRGNNPDDPLKRHPLDFVLWQAQAPGEPAWESPWGPGRPGWHIECSTLATKYLGETVSIHCGGADLIFPHHESEIAQVEPLTREAPFVRFWMHVAMLHYQGEKMSKSLGNLIMVRDLLETWSPDAIRLHMAQHHYRSSWSYDPVELQRAAELADKLRAAATAPVITGDPLSPEEAEASFKRAMNHDLDTPAALHALERLADQILAAAAAEQGVGEAQAVLRNLTGVLGLRLDNRDPEPEVVNGWHAHAKRFT